MTETNTPPSRPRVLIVDDEQQMRQVLHAYLRGEDLEILMAEDGHQAQDMLAGQAIDLAITDLAMPGLSGLGLMEWARSQGIDTSWIIISGYATLEDAVQAVRLGAFDFLSKPLDSPDSLIVRVRNALRQRALETEQKRLMREINDRNETLRKQVEQLKSACNMLYGQAENIAQDLRRAEIIQRALLPSAPPHIDGVSVNALYRPSNNVGGDLYNVLRLNDRYAAAYVADAAGHGVAAAMLAVLFKESLRGSGTLTAEQAPGDLLRNVNARLLGECRSLGLFVTAVYCLIDTQTRSVRIASAGHPPLLVHRASGEIETIYHTGPALGITAESRFAETLLHLHDGDRLFLYTDGLFNAPEGAVALNLDTVADMLTQRSQPGQQQLRAVLDAADKRRGEEVQEDDITMVMISADKVESMLDNGSPSAPGAGKAVAFPPRTEVLIGTTNGTTVISIQGQGKWMFCTAFHDVCRGELESGHRLTLDMSLCDYLDSTFLGTVQEVADCADNLHVPLHIQGVLPELRHLFLELGMDRVIEHISPEMTPLPKRMTPLSASSADTPQSRRSVLQAHEVLASLNEENRRKFGGLIEVMLKEIQQCEKPDSQP